MGLLNRGMHDLTVQGAAIVCESVGVGGFAAGGAVGGWGAGVAAGGELESGFAG